MTISLPNPVYWVRHLSVWMKGHYEAPDARTVSRVERGIREGSSVHQACLNAVRDDYALWVAGYDTMGTCSYGAVELARMAISSVGSLYSSQITMATLDWGLIRMEMQDLPGAKFQEVPASASMSERVAILLAGVARFRKLANLPR